MGKDDRSYFESWADAVRKFKVGSQEIHARDSSTSRHTSLGTTPAPPPAPGATVAAFLLGTFCLGAVSTSAATFAFRRYFKRIPNTDWITPDILAKKRWIKGRVTSVGDADGFRLYHTPSIGWHWPIKLRKIPTGKGLTNNTISVRLAGIDAPEGKHFGRIPQVYYEESLAWLTDKILDKTVYCQLISKDQYGRVLAVVHSKPRFLPGWMSKGENVSIAILRAGWAVTYQQGGAQYGEWKKEDFLAIEVEARAARRGQWVDGTTHESPAEYKRRHAAAAGKASEPAAVGSTGPEEADRMNGHPPGLLSRLWSSVRK